MGTNLKIGDEVETIKYSADFEKRHGKTNYVSVGHKGKIIGLDYTPLEGDEHIISKIKYPLVTVELARYCTVQVPCDCLKLIDQN